VNKQKRGPKLKQLKFRTAKELKSMVSKSTEDDLMEYAHSADGRSENTENADNLGRKYFIVDSLSICSLLVRKYSANWIDTPEQTLVPFLLLQNMRLNSCFLVHQAFHF
jgi:hypothetical protein